MNNSQNLENSHNQHAILNQHNSLPVVGKKYERYDKQKSKFGIRNPINYKRTKGDKVKERSITLIEREKSGQSEFEKVLVVG